MVGVYSASLLFLFCVSHTELYIVKKHGNQILQVPGEVSGAFCSMLKVLIVPVIVHLPLPYCISSLAPRVKLSAYNTTVSLTFALQFIFHFSRN